MLFAALVSFSPGGNKDKVAVLHFIHTHTPPPARTATDAEATLTKKVISKLEEGV